MTTQNLDIDLQDLDMVNSPKHYRSPSGVECIDIIRYLPTTLANASKYMFRIGHKWDDLEDAKKAVFYLQDFEEHLFKHKKEDLFFHSLTLSAAQMVFSGKIRDNLRTHIVWLQENKEPAYDYFQALYDFLERASRKSQVSHTRFSQLVEAAESMVESIDGLD